MGCIPYDTADDANRRLRGTIVLYKNEPHYCSGVEGPGGRVVDPSHIAAIIYPLPYNGRGALVIPITDPDLRVEGFNTGFVNGNNATSWWRRVPVRGSLQGLSHENFNFIMLDENIYYEHNSFNQVISSTALRDMFLNKYPDIPRIREKFKDRHADWSQAFAKNFALKFDSFRGDCVLYYKTTPVGYGPVLTDGVHLHKDFSHLTEQLRENKINVIR